MRRLCTSVRKDAGVPSSTARGGHGPEEQAEEPALLRAENARLRKAGKEWQLDRKVLRRAAACSAKEVK